MGRNHQPAEGERRAVRNLSAQYKVAALLAYETLRQGELEWVHLVDPDAGRLDDVLIARPGHLHAYQIKWSEYRGSVTFNKLVTSSKVSGKIYPAPIELMANGWEILRTTYPGRRIHAHYLMHDTASSQDGVSGPGEGDPPHLQSFLRHGFARRKEWFSTISNVHVSWSQKIQKLLEVSKLSQDKFKEFIVDSDINLGFDLPDRNDQEGSRQVDDIDRLAKFFMDRVANSNVAVKLTREDILRGVGWSDRFELRFKHDFPVDDRLYQPIKQTVDSIDGALKRFRQGYIALIGAPGSGKSTTLTQVLRYRTGIRLVRYYAFVRDDPRVGRGEAFAFLHDLCVALAKQSGNQSNLVKLPSSLNELRDHMGCLLVELGQEAQTNGIRTVILIDGLDHIEREQSPERSLIQELPPPSNVPDGVLIILGTQHVGLNGPSPTLRPIRAQLEEDGRKITMSPLSRQNVRDLVNIAVAKEMLRPGDGEIIYRRSAGHPLSLAYLLKRLLGVTNLTGVSAILDSNEDYDGNIYAEYSAYWDRVKDDVSLREILALLSRVQGILSIAAIKILSSQEVQEKFVLDAFHFFRQLSKRRWAFFHNSFRQFILRKTSVDAFGETDANINSTYHQALANAALKPNAPTELRWEALYHLEQARDLTDLVSEASQDWFRKQYFEGRPLEGILEDIRRAMRAAASTQDTVAIARLLLVNKELEERRDALDQVPITELRLELSEEDTLEDLLLCGNDLLVPQEIALAWSGKLKNDGKEHLSLKIFEAAEPIEMLGGIRKISQRGSPLLNTWASVAWQFRSIDDIYSALNNLKVEASSTTDDVETESDPAADQHLRYKILEQVGFAMQDAGDATAYAKLIARLQTTEIGRRTCTQLDFRTAQRATDDYPVADDPIAAMQRVLAACPHTQTPAVEAAFFADILVRMPELSQEASAYLSVIPGVLARTRLKTKENSLFWPLEALFRQARAAAACGRPIDPDAIPDQQEDYNKGYVLFQRLMVCVGTLAGEAIGGATLTPKAFLRRLSLLLFFHRRSPREVLNWHNGSAVNEGIIELWKHALIAAKAHGEIIFHDTISALTDEWIRNPRDQEMSWPLDTRRQIILHAYMIDHDIIRTRRLLESLDREINPAWELHDRLEALYRASQAWICLGCREEARTAFGLLLESSFGIYHHKDHQIQDWVKWILRLIEVNPGAQIIEGAVEKLLRMIALLFKENRGGSVSEATGELIEAIACRWPEQARIIGEWLLDRGVALRRTVVGALLAAELRSGDRRRVKEALTATGHLIVSIEGYEDHIGRAIAALVGSPLLKEVDVAEAWTELRRVAETLGGSPELVAEILGTPKSPRSSRSTDAPNRAGTLRTVDGKTLSQTDLVSLGQHPLELLQVLSNVQYEDGIDWELVFSSLCTGNVIEKIRQVSLSISQCQFNSLQYEHLVRLAITEGETKLAGQMIEQMIAQGQPNGWARLYDGGSRLSVSRSIRLLDPTGGRARALALFAQDFANSKLSAHLLILHMDEILAEFVDVIPVRNIWVEIEENLLNLNDLKVNNFTPPTLDFSDASDISVNAAQLLLREIDVLPQALAWEARKGLVGILLQGDPTGTVQHRLRAALSGSLRDQAAALAVLQGLAELQGGLATGFIGDVEALAWADFGVVRLAAQKFLTGLHRPIPAAPIVKPLPPFYHLLVPPAPLPDIGLRGTITPLDKPLPDTNDPYDLFKMYHDSITEIANQTGFSFDLLVQRMAQFLSSVAPPESYSKNEEVRLRKLSDATGVRLTSRRLRALATQHAFGRLISELCDCGRLTWPVRDVEAILAVADPIINMYRPRKRPSWVEVTAKREGSAYGAYIDGNAWVSSVNDALSPLETTPDGSAILAELTFIVEYDHERREERRLSVIAHSHFQFSDQQEVGIYSLRYNRNYSAGDYPNLFNFEDNIPSAVVAGGSVFATSSFIALNPVWGATLGWRTSSDGLFRWIDDAGQVMAESIAWADGNVEVYRSGGRHTSVSEGWFVLVSPAGWSQIRPHINSFVRHRKASRQRISGHFEEYPLKIAEDHIKIQA